MKRVNLLKVIENEIKKGNDLITNDGTFMSSESLEIQAERKFLECFRKGTISKKQTFEEYYKKELETCVDTQGLLAKLKSDYDLYGGEENGVVIEEGDSKGTKGVDKNDR